MTIANRITVGRILLIPVFVGFALYYGESVQDGTPLEWLRWAAVGTFVLASVSDAFDGWVARRFNQQSALGVVLDPIADKALVLAAIITLSFAGWPVSLPIWFAVLVVARDAVIVLGCMLLKHLEYPVEVRPSLMGKAATAMLMVVLTWVMLQLPFLDYSVWIASFFIVVSGLEYVMRGIRYASWHPEGEKRN